MTKMRNSLSSKLRTQHYSRQTLLPAAVRPSGHRVIAVVVAVVVVGGDLY